MGMSDSVELGRAPRAAPGRRGGRLRGVKLLLALIALMWVVEVADVLLAANLDQAGIRPRDEDGLLGILLAPFLHGGFGHLVGNTIPLLILGAVIALGGLLRVAAVTVIVAVIAGLGTWLLAPAGTLHIGASGVAFGYITYLIARGAFTRSVLHFATGALVAVFWGGTLLVGLLPEAGISWQGHLFGAVGGLVAARAVHRRSRP